MITVFFIYEKSHTEYHKQVIDPLSGKFNLKRRGLSEVKEFFIFLSSTSQVRSQNFLKY